MKGQSELKRCPFCGAMPTLRHETSFGLFKEGYFLDVEHKPECFFAQATHRNGKTFLLDFDEERLVALWNRRADDDTRSQELKPCPLCGSNVTGVFGEDFEEGHLYKANVDRVYYGGCGKCGAQTGPCLSKQEAVDAWNRRADDE